MPHRKGKVEAFEYCFISEIILAVNDYVHVVLDAEKRTALGDPSLPSSRPITEMGFCEYRNLGFQNIPVVFRRRAMAQVENMTATRDNVSARFGGSKNRERSFYT